MSIIYITKEPRTSMIWTMSRILIAFRTGVHFRSSSIGSSGISALFLQGSKKVLDVSKAEGTRISLWLLSMNFRALFAGTTPGCIRVKSIS